MTNWTMIAKQLPPEGVLVLTKIHDFKGERNEGILKREGKLWFDSHGIYVYYEPTHWAANIEPIRFY